MPPPPAQVSEEQESQQFVVDPDVAHGLVRADSPVEDAVRRYILRETKQRVHQPVFRATIMRAYGTRCAVCALAHTQLLDAAHIIPDSHERGLASVRNGLALCKIHHAAYDSNILGIRPDLVVQIKSDLLDEVDGPMLQYGLKERHNQRLMVLPQVRAERPGAEFLEFRYELFQMA
jgi:putative restriction endonuclease